MDTDGPDMSISVLGGHNYGPQMDTRTVLTEFAHMLTHRDRGAHHYVYQRTTCDYNCLQTLQPCRYYDIEVHHE